MKVLVCGSRDFTRKDMISSVLRTLAGTEGNLEIIHGGARGADRLAGEVAKEMGWPVKEFPADWEGQGKRAGIVRNVEMADYGPDIGVAFFKSGAANRGTQDMVSRLEARGIRVMIFWETK